jgi:hypothetical protein
VSSSYLPENFINKSSAGGVQIELTSALAADMFRGPLTSERIRQDPGRRTGDFGAFVQTVRSVLEARGGAGAGIKVESEEGKPPKRR